jgi:UDP-N-acetylmuramoyl-tripeptide--D-alanyl-D-alanine ligase
MSGLGLTLAQAARALGADPGPAAGRVRLSEVSTDTRTLRPGALFVALRGENFDGHRFLKRAFEGGAAAAVVDRPVRGPADRVLIRVPDTLRGLGDLAGFMRRRRPLRVAAVTGSNGKTTTKEMLTAVLETTYHTLSTAGNLNNLVGLPLTLFRLRPGHEAAVLEMGMNRPGEIARLTEIADPDVGLVTSVAPAHLEGVGGLRGVARAKGELYAGLKPSAVAVVNLDDPWVVRIAVRAAGPRLTFGFSRRADVRGRKVRRHGLKGVGFELVTPAGSAEVRLRLLGRHNVRNALAAAAAGTALGLAPDRIAAGLSRVGAYAGRLSLEQLPGPVYLLDDSYNANPASVEAGLEVLAEVRGRGRAVAVLGDMLELGAAGREEHARLGRIAAERQVDLLVGVGPLTRGLIREAQKSGLNDARTAWFADRAEAAAWLKTRLLPRDRVLVKGSRGMGMETVVQALVAEGESRA